MPAGGARRRGADRRLRRATRTAATPPPPQVITVGGAAAAPAATAPATTSTPGGFDVIVRGERLGGQVEQGLGRLGGELEGRRPPTNKKLKDLNSSSGADYQKKSQKLPKQVGTRGKPPPKDNKPAGGGTGFQEIG